MNGERRKEKWVVLETMPQYTTRGEEETAVYSSSTFPALFVSDLQPVEAFN